MKSSVVTTSRYVDFILSSRLLYVRISLCVQDPGIQHFGGKLFRSVRDKSDDVFCSFPAPLPARPILSFAQIAASQAGRASDTAVVAAQVPVLDMHAFNDAADPCFHEDCLVSVLSEDENGLECAKEIRIKDVRRGDRLLGGGVVLAVVKTLCRDDKVVLASLDNGLMVTPYHPIKLSKADPWVFPIDVCRSPPVSVSCKAIYSLVLDAEFSNYQSFSVCGYQVVALGHEIEGDAVASHSYLGARRGGVVEDLMRCSGWSNPDGVIVFNSGCMTRGNIGSECSSYINSLVYEKEIAISV
jgi:hypothetical protein